MKINFVRLDHFQICIPKGEEDNAKKFYTDFLGLKEISKPMELLRNGGLWYEITDIQLHIGIEDSTADSKRYSAFEIKNSHEVRKSLKDKEVIIKDEIQIPGMTRFSFRDPFGKRIELLE